MAFLSTINLQNFRSYRAKSFHFSPQLTVIVGANTSGKTNLIEAISLLATGKSFRAQSDREMIGYGEEISRISGQVQSPKSKVQSDKEELINLEILLTTGQVQGERAPLKKYLVNGVPKRMVDFIGNLRGVVFWPQDLELVTSSPGKRRRYLDTVLSQADWEYRRTLPSYERAIRSRNRVLERIREGQANPKELFFWDQLVIKQGEYITRKRQEYIDFINNKKIQFDDQRMEIEYDHSFISEARLAHYNTAEIASATTLVGPHRDDFVVKLMGDKRDKGSEGKEGRNLHFYGSRGEQRLGVLRLKLMELDYLEEKTGDRPILLLDDIFSELDHAHRHLVMEIIGKQQTIITTTDEHFIEKNTISTIITLP